MNVWCCPSRGRPESIKRLIQAWHDTDSSSVLDLRLDNDDPFGSCYRDIEYPHFWHVRCGKRTKAAGAMNETFRLYPKAKSYGFIGDDGVPRTSKWDRKLSKAAGDWNVAYPSDLHKNRCSHPVCGGELVRAVGWFALPGLNHLYIDTVWANIGLEIGRLIYLSDVIVEHMHPAAKKGVKDQTYMERTRGGNDIRVFEDWKQSSDYRQLIRRLKSIAQ